MAEPSERPGLFRRLLGSSQSERIRTARYPFQAYGKLPIYKDFISVGLTDPAAREFRQWIDRGYSYRWAENEAYRDTLIPPHGFLLRLPESRACVAGILWGSSDEGGLRKFPFAVFLSFPSGQPAGDLFAALHYLAALERQCGEIREGYAAGASLSAFYKAYRGAEFECALPTREQANRELKSALAALTVSELAESLFGAAALERWPALAFEVEGAMSRADSAGAIRLPLSGALPRSREIGFWLRWLERPAAARKRSPAGLLYTAGRGPGRAAFFFRDLQSEDFLLLHPSERGQPGILDVGVVEVAGPVVTEAVPFPEALAGEPLVTTPRETLSALVAPALDPVSQAAAAVPPALEPSPSPDPAPPAVVEAQEPAPPVPTPKQVPEPSDWKKRLDAVVGL
jgi:type VI secretion system ImpM family protein